MNETLLFNTKELLPETFFQKLNQLLRKLQALGDFLAHVSDFFLRGKTKQSHKISMKQYNILWLFGKTFQVIKRNVLVPLQVFTDLHCSDKTPKYHTLHSFTVNSTCLYLGQHLITLVSPVLVSAPHYKLGENVQFRPYSAKREVQGARETLHLQLQNHVDLQKLSQQTVVGVAAQVYGK